MSNKIISTKKNSAIFLIAILVAGTIAVSSTSFMIIGAAQAQPYFGIDKKYNSYKPHYEMDSYDKPISIYDDKKLYDDKPKYPSYDKEDRRDKSKKDSSKSVNINKFNCINTNLNINGNNAGNVSIGNKGQGYLGTYSSNGGGYGSGEGYDNKQAKGFDCIINNNNTNVNTVGGNVTGDGADGGNRAIEECILCFIEADVPDSIEITATILTGLESLSDTDLDLVIGEDLTILDLCELLEGLTRLLEVNQFEGVIDLLFIEILPPDDPDRDILIACLLRAGIIIDL